MFLIPAFGRLKQEGSCDSEASLGYLERPCLKRRKEGEREEKVAVTHGLPLVLYRKVICSLHSQPLTTDL